MKGRISPGIRTSLFHPFTGITILPDLSPNDINVNTAVLHLLPTQPSISHLVTAFLIQLQNNCIDTAARVTRERQR